MGRKAILSGATALAIMGCAQAPPGPDPAELDAVLQQAVDGRQVPFVVATAATREGIVYEGAVGQPVDAIVAIASMTKPVTSVAVMQLVEAGKVQLDEPAHTYVPALGAVQVLENGERRPPASPPTVRQLLTHMSGFAYEFLNPEIADLVKTGSLPTLFAGTDEFLQAPLVFDPGVRWEYGISTDWLGRLVETVSGQTLEAYFRSRIFEPLAMTDTFFEVPADQADRMAATYARQPDGSLAALPRESPRPPAFLSGGGGLYSTAADYLRFARALLGDGAVEGRRILRPETVTMMAQNQIGDLTLPPMVSLNPQLISPEVTLPGRPDAFGLGFAFNRQAAASGRGAGSLTWAGAYNTFFWVDREKGRCAVLLTQVLPFGDPGAVRVVEDFERAWYR